MPSISTDVVSTNQAKPWLPILETIRALRANATVKAVAMALHGYCGSKCYCWPSVKTLALASGASARTVQRAVKKLVEAGVITVEVRMRPNGSHTSNIYRFELSLPPSDVTPPEDKTNPKDSNHAARGDGSFKKRSAKRYTIPIESFAKYKTSWKHYKIAVSQSWIDGSEDTMLNYLATWARCWRLYRDGKIDCPAAIMVWAIKNRLLRKLPTQQDEMSAGKAIKSLRNDGTAVI